LVAADKLGKYQFWRKRQYVFLALYVQILPEHYAPSLAHSALDELEAGQYVDLRPVAGTSKHHSPQWFKEQSKNPGI
jgi:hypothetical protein